MDLRVGSRHDERVVRRAGTQLGGAEVNTVWRRRLGASILVLEAAVVGLWTDLFVRMWLTSAAWDDESTAPVWLFSGVWTLLTIGIPLAAAVVL